MHNAKLLFYGLCRSLGLFRLAAWMTRDRLRILCYHGFALQDEAEFRPKLFIRPQTFERRLAAICRYGMQITPLDEAVERLYAGTLPSYSLTVTIDDGFHAVSKVAAPALHRNGIPATVYVTTYYVEHDRPIFRLVIQYMFWKSRLQRVDFPQLQRSASRTVDLTDAGLKEQLTWECIRFGETRCTEDQRTAICLELGELLKVPYGDVVRTRILSLMTPGELRGLSGAAIDVQLHTHRHSFPDDSKDVAVTEIIENRLALARFVGAGEKRHFCYPSGIWNERQWPWLDELGVKSSTTCLAGSNSSTTPRHALRRFLDGENIHQLEFEAALTGFSDLVLGCARGLGGRLRA